ncbi:MAG: bifunctional metallophosphatase/5'-nucleotidase [Bacteroidota bacterium]
MNFRCTLFACFALLLCISGCDTTKKITDKGSKDDGKIELIFLQINDVYEIAPLPGDDVGGLARVATVRKELLAENPNTFTVLSGDFLSPSLIGTLKYEGKRIRGKQMVDALNAVGVDYITFGNHEFDIRESELLERLGETRSDWVSTNVLHNKNGELVPFQTIVNGQWTDIPEHLVKTVSDDDGTQINVGYFGITLPSNQQDYVHYDDFTFKSVEAVGKLKSQTDLIVAITHVDIKDDLAIAGLLPDISLVMGGHDHDNMIHKVGNTIVAKADANAKTVYIHRVLYNKNSKVAIINSELKKIDNTLVEDPEVKAVVDKWVKIADDAFADEGFDQTQEVFFAREPLDGRESSIRNKSTNLGLLIAKAMTKSTDLATDCALFNSGSVRVDDQLSGKVTQYDVLRTLPFGGGILIVEMKPRLLKKLLEIGEGNKGTGGFLQRDRADYKLEGKQWMINGEPLDFNRNYKVLLTDFLLTGLETNMGFLTPENPDIVNIIDPDENNEEDLRNDIRQALIHYLLSINH